MLKKTVFFIGVLLVVSGAVPVLADTALTVDGLGAIKENDTVQAEKEALDDAFRKALVIASLRHVPDAAVENLMAVLSEYIDTRGIQDVIQYKITSRSRQQDVMRLTVDLKLKDDYLTEWLHNRVMTTPTALKPSIILMISSSGDSSADNYFWWRDRGLSYSPFEVALAGQLVHRGQNVVIGLPKSFAVDGDLVRIAQEANADLVVSGQIAYHHPNDEVWDISADLRLVEVATGKEVGSWSLRKRSDFSRQEMNNHVAEFVSREIARKSDAMVVKVNPVAHTKILVIAGTRDYTTYQAIISALKSMDAVEQIELRSIHGHALTHDIRILGSYEDVLRSLTTKQIADLDIKIKDDTATVQIIAR